jgi:hypothetical protein
VNEIATEIDVEIEWWRPLVQWLWCVPHLVVNALLSAASIVVWVVSLPVVLATGRLPAWMARFQVLVLRERARTFAYLFALRRDHPPFGWSPDPRSRLSVLSSDVASVSRLSAVTRPIEVLPHALFLLPIGACLDLLYPVWMVVVAVNRGWPMGMARTLVAIERWVVTIILYATCASDERPTWGFEANRSVATA